jgi:hypothetical protein
MTALKQYEKLESPGLWRQTPQEQRREVYVSFGDTSLVIRDRNDAALAHWSLPAITRLNPGDEPAIFSPDPDASETLEIEDSTMTEAIEKVRQAINKRRPHPGRLRLVILLGISATILALGLFWLPGALIRQTVRVAPFETRLDIGNELLGQIARLAGETCQTTPGTNALRDLNARVLGAGRTQVLVLAEGLNQSANLPGGIFLLNKSLVEDYDSAEVAASYLLVEKLRRSQLDPLEKLLRQAGGLASFRLLTTGHLDDKSLAAYARFVLTEALPMPSDQSLLKQFERAGFSSSKMAYSLDISGETTLTLIEADPFSNKQYQPLLPDSAWLSLQSICGG